MRLSVVIPTIGRPGLARAVASCVGADEIIVVLDRAAPAEDWLTDIEDLAIPENVRVIDCYGGDHGYTARTFGMQAATGSHLCFLDDDDVYTGYAISLFREAACNVPVIFRMDHYAHGVLWRQPVLEFGNVSTQMFVVPNAPDKLGAWEPHAPELKEPGGDFTFLAGCAEKMGAPIWREEIVATLRPDFCGITVVTPWRNHPELAADYLAAVSGLGPRDCLRVVDCGSEPPIDGILNRATFRSEENLGFIRGSNLGLREARTAAVLFLNNDIQATRPDWLEAIRAKLEPGVLVGTQLRYDPHANVDGQQMPYLDGWCLAGMRDDLEELGGFEEDLEDPGYYSDNVLCLRARAAGFMLREARTGLIHLNGVTSGASRGVDVSASTNANYQYYADEARALLMEAVA